VADEQYAPALAAASTFAGTHERRQIDFVLPVSAPEMHAEKCIFNKVFNFKILPLI